MNTVLITGCSSGFGLATARYFLDRDWQVIAAMRAPNKALLPSSGQLRIIELDVSDASSIATAVSTAGSIDALVNNAGIGVLAALEATSTQTAAALFATNTLGTIAMTRAVLPQFRERRSGAIVNLGSAVTLQPVPYASVYAASKAAIEAFSASLSLELDPFNIRVRTVLPGRAPETNFGVNARARVPDGIPPAYQQSTQHKASSIPPSAVMTHPIDVAEAVWRAATQPACPEVLPAGADAVALAEARSWRFTGRHLDEADGRSRDRDT